MFKKKPLPLNTERDDYVTAMRALVAEFAEVHPDDLKGILGRAESILGLQLPALERLAVLDLDATTPASQDVIETLVRAQHLPRMILALGEVMIQEEKKRTLRPLQEEALALGRQLAALTQRWLIAHSDEIEEIEEL